MALFALLARFAVPEKGACSFSPDEFAKCAHKLGKGAKLTIDEIRASVVLCFYDMSQSVSWDSVTEIAKLTKMAELYHTWCLKKQKKNAEQTDRLREGRDIGCVSFHSDDREGLKHLQEDMEEWKNVWWCVYSLDTCCSAIA